MCPCMCVCVCMCVSSKPFRRRDRQTRSNYYKASFQVCACLNWAVSNLIHNTDRAQHTLYTSTFFLCFFFLLVPLNNTKESFFSTTSPCFLPCPYLILSCLSIHHFWGLFLLPVAASLFLSPKTSLNRSSNLRQHDPEPNIQTPLVLLSLPFPPSTFFNSPFLSSHFLIQSTFIFRTACHSTHPGQYPCLPPWLSPSPHSFPLPSSPSLLSPLLPPLCRLGLSSVRMLGEIGIQTRQRRTETYSNWKALAWDLQGMSTMGRERGRRRVGENE